MPRARAENTNNDAAPGLDVLVVRGVVLARWMVVSAIFGLFSFSEKAVEFFAYVIGKSFVWIPNLGALLVLSLLKLLKLLGQIPRALSKLIALLPNALFIFRPWVTQDSHNESAGRPHEGASGQSPRKHRATAFAPEAFIDIPADSEQAVLRIMSVEETHFYHIIGAPRAATGDELKKHFRRQSLLVHPDKNKHKHAMEAFKRLSAAYEALGDEETRQKYDQELDDAENGPDGGFR
eukprot:m.39682 g.39682  ORF g.39682 m.39682 type:complete len:236 (-) comp5572_c0_seq2:699-1406(-)